MTRAKTSFHTKVRAGFVGRQRITPLTPSSTSVTTCEQPTPASSPMTSSVGGGSSTSGMKCARDPRHQMIGRFVEDISCLQCGYTPPTPEQDSWLDALAEMAEIAKSNGGYKGEPRMVGTSR